MKGHLLTFIFLMHSLIEFSEFTDDFSDDHFKNTTILFGNPSRIAWCCDAKERLQLTAEKCLILWETFQKIVVLRR